MKTIKDYLENIREIKGSDYAVAKALDITQPSIIKIKKGGNIKDETAIKIADILQIDEEEVLIAASIERSKNIRIKKAWENISKRSGYAASVFLATEGVATGFYASLADKLEALKLYIM